MNTQLTNSFQINRVHIGPTETGTWDTAGVDQADPRMLAFSLSKFAVSNYIGGAFVNNNTTVNGAIVNNTFRDMTFGTPGNALVQISTAEGWKLVDDVLCIFECVRNEPFDGNNNFDFTVISSGGTVEFRFKWLIDEGSGYVDFPDNVEALVAVGSSSQSVSKKFPLNSKKGDRIKPQITRNSGTSTIITSYATIYITQ